MRLTRRDFLLTSTALTAAAFAPAAFAQASPRRYHLSVSVEGLDTTPGLLERVQAAGVTDIWLAAFFYGHWPYPLERLLAWKKKAEALGLAVHFINVPLGHPGDSLGAKSGTFPLTPPEHWHLATRPDGTTYAGTSLHAPATDENCAALKQLVAAGADTVFLDDDFRLARGPGVIGGCFCEEHRKRFCGGHGYSAAQWDALLADVNDRRLTPILRDWVNFTCDELTTCFRTQHAVRGPFQLGIMVMYLGAEKAGIRLSDYKGVPFRIGELMFDDHSFDPVRGKTNELFSALFHRGYVSPQLAFSETTAYPSDKLSAANMAAKLTISTIADVGNTMFMSGVTPFPITHWDTLAPTMREQAELHARVAGHDLKGPFMYFWGEASRYVGEDEPYSLFLAAGVPFSIFPAVMDGPGFSRADKSKFLAYEDMLGVVKARGMAHQGAAIFLSEADAVHLANTNSLVPLVTRTPHVGARTVPETLEALFALKRDLRQYWTDIPIIDEDKPAVCAWYPSAGGVIVWNLSPTREAITVVRGDTRRNLELGPLASTFVEI